MHVHKVILLLSIISFVSGCGYSLIGKGGWGISSKIEVNINPKPVCSDEDYEDEIFELEDTPPPKPKEPNWELYQNGEW